MLDFKALLFAGINGVGILGLLLVAGFSVGLSVGYGWFLAQRIVGL